MKLQTMYQWAKKDMGVQRKNYITSTGVKIGTTENSKGFRKGAFHRMLSNKQGFLNLKRELYLPPWGCWSGGLAGTEKNWN